MNPTQQRKPMPARKASRTDNPIHPKPQSEPEEEVQSAEEVRQSSQTAQDRDHTIRGGDSATRQTKEFPT
jgi:hypothetical protein